MMTQLVPFCDLKLINHRMFRAMLLYAFRLYIFAAAGASAVVVEDETDLLATDDCREVQFAKACTAFELRGKVTLLGTIENELAAVYSVAGGV